MAVNPAEQRPPMNTVLDAFGLDHTPEGVEALSNLRYGDFDLDAIRERIPDPDTLNAVMKVVWNDKIGEKHIRSQALVTAAGDLKTYRMADTGDLKQRPTSDHARSLELIADDDLDADWVLRNYGALVTFIERHDKRASRASSGGYVPTAILYLDEQRKVISRLATYGDMPGVRTLDQIADLIDPAGFGRQDNPDHLVDLFMLSEPQRSNKKSGYRTVGRDFILTAAYSLGDADLDNPDVRDTITRVSRIRYDVDNDRCAASVRECAAQTTNLLTLKENLDKYGDTWVTHAFHPDVPAESRVKYLEGFKVCTDAGLPASLAHRLAVKAVTTPGARPLSAKSLRNDLDAAKGIPGELAAALLFPNSADTLTDVELAALEGVVKG